MILALPLLSAIGAWSVAGAQGAAASPAPSCFASMPAEALTRLPVFLVSSSDDRNAEALRPVTDLFASMVGERMRAILGATPDQLPVGGTTIGWRDLGPGLSVTLHRDGTFTWREPSDAGVGEGASWLVHARSSAATDSLVRALEVLRESGERYFWPEEVKSDRLTFHLYFTWQMVSGDGTVVPLQQPFAVPVLAADMPRRSPVVPISIPTPRYPQQHQQNGISGTVIMRFVVDEGGRVRESSIRDLWTSDAPQPRGDAGRLYRGFVRSVRSALVEARFEPATLGGCPVPQLAQQPFVFAFR